MSEGGKVIPIDPITRSILRSMRCGNCGSTQTTMVQYGRGPGTLPQEHSCHIDGWSEIKCTDCNTRTGRWTGNVLKGTFEDGEHEPPYGGKHRFGCKFHKPKLKSVE